MPYRSPKNHVFHIGAKSVGAPRPRGPHETSSDYSGKDQLVRALISGLRERWHLTAETQGQPILPWLDLKIGIDPGIRDDARTLEWYQEVREEYTEDNPTIDEFVCKVDDYLNVEIISNDSYNDESYGLIYEICRNPFIWSIFKEDLPPLILVDQPEDALDAHSTRGMIVSMDVASTKIGLALSSLGICLNGDAFLAIYAAMAAICRLANSFTDEEFKVLLDSIPVDLVDAPALHQLGMKLITIIVYEFVDRPPGSMIVYREALKAILENSRWPYFQQYLDVIEKH